MSNYTKVFIRVEKDSATGLLITQPSDKSFSRYLRPGDTAEIYLPPDYDLQARPESPKKPGFIEAMIRTWFSA